MVQNVKADTEFVKEILLWLFPKKVDRDKQQDGNGVDDP